MKKLLPDLSKNIVCGNSLIGTDILDGQLFGSEEERKLKPMNFEDAFPEVMKLGGFDAIVGNPPYVEFKRLDAKLKSFLERQSYKTVSGKYDLYIPFVERAVSLVRINGLIGYIIPTMFTKRDYGKALRAFLSHEAPPIGIVDFSDFQVFAGVTNYVGTFVLLRDKGKVEGCECLVLTGGRTIEASIVQSELADRSLSKSFQRFIIKRGSIGIAAWSLVSQTKIGLLDRLKKESNCSDLGNVADYIWEGIASGKDESILLARNHAQADEDRRWSHIASTSRA